MADGDGLAVDAACGDRLAFLEGEVGDDLVAVEVEIDPVLARAALGAAHQLAIEGAGRFQAVDGEGEVEAGAGLGWRGGLGHGDAFQHWFHRTGLTT